MSCILIRHDTFGLKTSIIITTINSKFFDCLNTLGYISFDPFGIISLSKLWEKSLILYKFSKVSLITRNFTFLYFSRMDKMPTWWQGIPIDPEENVQLNDVFAGLMSAYKYQQNQWKLFLSNNLFLSLLILLTSVTCNILWKQIKSTITRYNISWFILTKNDHCEFIVNIFWAYK